MAEESNGVDRLVSAHGEETVRKAFWLQQHIYEEGLDGIHFSDAAEADMEEMGPMLIKAAIEREFNRNI